MRARDIMTPNPSVVTRDTTIAHAALLMRTRHVGMLPVIDDLRARHLVGIVTDRDIVTRCVAREQDIDRHVGELMTGRQLAVAHTDAGMEEVMGLMQRRGLRRIPILDERERVVGVIAQTDLVKSMRPRSSSASTASNQPSMRTPRRRERA